MAPSAGARWLVASVTMLAAFVGILDISIANVALNHMRGSLSAGVDEITWVFTSFLVANAVSLPVTGWLTDLVGRRRLFVASTASFTLASVACGAAPTLTLLVIARVLQGLTGGPLVPLSQAIMMETFPPRQQGLAMAAWGVGVMVAPIVGPTLGGWITDNWSWRWIFYLNVPVGFLCAGLGQLVLPEPPGPRRGVRRIDGWGLLLLVVGIGSLQFVLDRGQREDWFHSPLITELAVIAGVALVLLVVHELRHPEPAVDLRVLRHRTFAIATVLMALMSVALYGVIVLSPLFTQLLMGYTALLAGLVIAPGGLATMLTMPLAGLLINRIDPRWIVGAGYALGAAAMYEMTALTPDATFWQITWPRFVQGLGIGLMFVPLSTVALAAVPAGELAHASGLFSFIRTIGGSVGIAIVTTLLERGRQVHQARLVEHVSLYDPEVWQRHQGLVATLAARGADEVSAQQQAWAVLYGSVQKQALFLSFMDNFWRLAWMFCLLIPLLALMGRPRRASPVGRPA